MSLHTDLVNAGLPVSGTATQGKTVLFTRSLTAQEEVVYESIVNLVKYKQSLARPAAQAIPDWSTWTPDEWATWQNSNISSVQINAIGNLADAKAVMLKMSLVMNNMAKMIIALRDYVRIIE